jgi:hypothetical protein
VEAEQRAAEAREAEARESERQALQVLRNAEELLEDGDVNSAIRVVEERMDQLLRPTAPEAAERSRIFLWNAVCRLQQEQQAANDRAAARADQAAELQSQLTSAETMIASANGSVGAQEEVIEQLKAQLSQALAARDAALEDTARGAQEMEGLRGDCVGTLQSAEAREAKLTSEQERLDGELARMQSERDTATAKAEQTAVAAREAALAAEHDRKTLTNRVAELQAELSAGAALASELEQKLGKAVEQTEAAMASADAWQAKHVEVVAHGEDLTARLAAAEEGTAGERRRAEATAEEHGKAVQALKEDRADKLAAAAAAQAAALATALAERETALAQTDRELAARAERVLEAEAAGAAAAAAECARTGEAVQALEAERAARAAAVETLRVESTKILGEQTERAAAVREDLELKLQAARANTEATQRELEEAEQQLRTNREEAATLSRRLAATDDERELERRKTQEAADAAAQAADVRQMESAAETKALSEQASWRETLVSLKQFSAAWSGLEQPGGRSEQL